MCTVFVHSSRGDGGCGGHPCSGSSRRGRADRCERGNWPVFKGTRRLGGISSKLCSNVRLKELCFRIVKNRIDCDIFSANYTIYEKII